MKKFLAISIWLIALVACSGEDGANGVDGSAGKDGRDGKNGTDCNVVPKKDENNFYVICANEIIGMLYNGAEGSKGDSGETGSSGEAGHDGADCELQANEDVFDVLCGGVKVGTLQDGDDGFVGNKGSIAENCNIESVSENDREGTKITCGETSKIVWNGVAGEDAMGSVVCGITKYDATTQFCDGITLYDYCDGKVYDPATQFCSESNAVTTKCGTDTYNTTTQFCYNSKVYSKCNGANYNPTTEECFNNAVEYAFNITYGTELVHVTRDSLYVTRKNGDTIAVNMGLTSSSGKRLYIATANLVVKKDGTAYIPNNPGYKPSSRWYTSSATEWDLFGWGDATGKKISTSLSDYPSSSPPTEISGNASYDIVRNMLKGNWRLPKRVELNNYVSGQNSDFSSEVSTITRSGRLWTSAKMKTKVFFPFVGLRYGTTMYNDGKDGTLWQGTRGSSTENVDCLYQNSSVGEWAARPRYDGRSVRPFLEL